MGVRLLAVVGSVLVLAGCGGSDSSQTETSPGEVAELRSLATLKTAFAEDDGKPRVLLLLSPT